MKPSKSEVLKEALEHPKLVQKYGIGIAEQIVRDHHNRPKTNTPEGKKTYQKTLMRRKRLLKKTKGKNLNSADFTTLWKTIFENPKNPAPKVNYRKWQTVGRRLDAETL